MPAQNQQQFQSLPSLRSVAQVMLAACLGWAGSALAETSQQTQTEAVEPTAPVSDAEVTPEGIDESADAATTPRHVILIIGDGMDDHQVTIARNYLKGARGRLTLDKMPVRGTSQILTVSDDTKRAPVYVADSANTATSMATGAVTSRGRVGTSAGDDQDLVTLAELASAAGYRTGLVATSSITDATPASFAAHISFRLCENPARMELVEVSNIELGNCRADMKANGGPGSIAEQLAESSVDVLLGGGAQHFEETAEGMTISVKRLAEKQGFKVITQRDELLQATPGQRVLGVFADSTMPVRMRGQDGRESAPVERSLLNRIHTYLGSAELPGIMDCEANPEFAGMPSLKEMTDAALALLSADNERGFFLMVESASIDKQAHERKPCGSIGELEQLEEALQSALAFAEANPDTLIIVTADHSQAAQLIPEQSLFAAYPIPTFTPGMLSRIRSPEGAVMAVNYATTNFFYEEHTGANVPVFANQVGQGIVPPYLQQPELFTIMRDYLRLAE